MELEIKSGIRLGMKGPQPAANAKGNTHPSTSRNGHKPLNMHSVTERMQSSIDFDGTGDANNYGDSRNFSKEKFSVDVSAIESASKVH